MDYTNVEYRYLHRTVDRAWVKRDIFRKVPDIDLFCRQNPLLYEQILGALHDREGTCIVSIVSGRIVGYVLVGLDVRASQIHGEIVALHVVDAFRRRGIGTHLVSTALDWLACSGSMSISVLVSPTNSAALRLYESLGLRPSTLEMEIPAAKIMSLRNGLSCKPGTQGLDDELSAA